MAESKGFRVIAKINLPPQKQYQSGDSIIVQSDELEEVALILGAIAGGGVDQGMVILGRFGHFALASGVEVALKKGTPHNAAAELHLVAAPASAALRKTLAKKLGKTDEELGELTTEEAKSLLRGGNK